MIYLNSVSFNQISNKAIISPETYARNENIIFIYLNYSSMINDYWVCST